MVERRQIVHELGFSSGKSGHQVLSSIEQSPKLRTFFYFIGDYYLDLFHKCVIMRELSKCIIRNSVNMVVKMGFMTLREFLVREDLDHVQLYIML